MEECGGFICRLKRRIYDNDQILCECEGLGRFDEATFEMVTFLRFAVRLLLKTNATIEC